MSDLSRMIEMEHEVGKSNVPPKLLRLEDYYGWKDRFESYCRFHDITIWLCIKNGYVAPTAEVGNATVIVTYDRMNDHQKKEFTIDNKAHSSIKMSLPKEINHQLKSFHTAKELWDALEKRCEGSPQVKAGKCNLLKKQFMVFKAFREEDLEAYTTRFYHLLSELDDHAIFYNDKEKTDKFIEGLPCKWEMYGIMLKDNDERYATMTLEKAIDKLRGYDFSKRTRDTDSDHLQNPGLYHGKTSISNSSSNSTTALFAGEIDEIGEKLTEDLCFIASDSGEKRNRNTTSDKSTQGHHKMPMSVKSAEQQLSVLASFVASYENYIQGKINDPAQFDEDYDQVDPDDLEEMDLQWQLAMVSRRVKNFLKRTGKRVVGNRPGFDKSKVKCYNCQGYGHFARECQRPKVDAGTSKQDSGSNLTSKVLVVQQIDGSYDWSTPSEQALMAEIDDLEKQIESTSYMPTTEELQANVPHTEVKGIEEDVLYINSTEELSPNDFVAYMADIQSEKKKVCLDLLTLTDVCYLVTDLQTQVSVFAESNKTLTSELDLAKSDVRRLGEDKLALNEKIKSDALDKTSLTDIINEQCIKIDGLYLNLNELNRNIAIRDKELSESNMKLVELNRKFEGYRTSSLTLNRIIGSQRSVKDVTGLGYSDVPPPFNANYTASTSVDLEMTDVNPETEDLENQQSIASEIQKETVNDSSLTKSTVKSLTKVQFVSSGMIGSTDGNNEVIKKHKELPSVSFDQIKKESAKTAKSRKQMSCFKCHQRGHVSSCCPNKKNEVAPKREASDKSKNISSTDRLGTRPGIGIKPVTALKRDASHSVSPPKPKRHENFAKDQVPSRFMTPRRNQSHFEIGSTSRSQGVNQGSYNNRNQGQKFQGYVSGRVGSQSTHRPRTTSHQQADAPSKVTKAPNGKDGYFKELQFVDDKGRTKTVMAWVPLDN